MKRLKPVIFLSIISTICNVLSLNLCLFFSLFGIFETTTRAIDFKILHEFVSSIILYFKKYMEKKNCTLKGEGWVNILKRIRCLGATTHTFQRSFSNKSCCFLIKRMEGALINQERSTAPYYISTAFSNYKDK